MESKSIMANIAFVAVLVLSLSLVSATSSSVFSITDLSAPSNVNENAGSFTFTFNLTYTGGSNYTNFSFSDSTSSIGSVSIPNANGFDGTVDESRILTGTVTGFANQGGNPLNVRINASSSTGSRDDETSFSVAINDISNPPTPSNGALCARNGTLRISSFSVDNLGRGSDEEWEPLDEVEIEVEIENIDNNDDVSDVLVELFIFDDNDNDVTNDFDIVDEEVDLGKIKEDDQETAIFVIDEVPGDIEDGGYRIYIKAYSDGDEDLQCVSESSEFDNNDNNDLYHEVEVTRDEDEAVVVRDTDLEKVILASCGDKNVEVSFPIYNLGLDKEEKVLVNLYNSMLGIDEFQVVDNLKEGSKKEVTFFVSLPKGLELDNYNLQVLTYFQYDDGDELDIFSYDSNSEDDLDEDFRMKLEVLKCAGPAPLMTASLGSAAVVGEDLVVKASVTNNGNEEKDFDFSVSGFEGWAELVSINPENLKVDAGETAEFLVVLSPTKSGQQSFKINTVVEGEVFDQAVSVNIAEEKGIFNKVSKPTLYLIIAIAVMVFLIFVTLIVKILGKPRKSEF